MASNLELYEALKDKLGLKAARMLADSIPRAEGLATKADLEQLRLSVEGRIDRIQAELMRWMLTLFLPMYLVILGAVVTVILKA